MTMDRFVDAQASSSDRIVIVLMPADSDAALAKMDVSFREASVLIGSLQAALAQADERYRHDRIEWVRANYPTAIVTRAC